MLADALTSARRTKSVKTAEERRLDRAAMARAIAAEVDGGIRIEYDRAGKGWWVTRLGHHDPHHRLHRHHRAHRAHRAAHRRAERRQAGRAGQRARALGCG